MQRKKLLIISHTEHYQDPNGRVMGWGPTVNEVNFLSDYWEEVVHIACLHSGQAPSGSSAYTNENIRFVAIPPYGGTNFLDKLLVFTKLPKIISQVNKNIKGATEVQLRVPTAMGVFLIPYFTFFVKRKFVFWVKYAGDWNQKNPPLSYAFQRWWLKKNFAGCAVTINGFWPDQPKHCHSFENPSLTRDDILQGKKVSELKQFEAPFVFAFVGRLEDPKGVTRIIEALKKVPQNFIKSVHFIGDGKKMESYKNEASFLKDKVFFHGFLDKTQVHLIIKETHFLLLPSTASEGFPKVIAEAACYGAIPVVSNVGSINHYINESNGFIWKPFTEVSYEQLLLEAVNSTSEDLKHISTKATALAKWFTFDSYLQKLKETVLKENI